MDLQLHPISSNGSAIVRHYRTSVPIHVEWENYRIVRLAPTRRKPTLGLWAAPGLFDLQVNGYAGVDFQTDGDLTEEALVTVTRALRDQGCTRFLLTFITAPWKKLLETISNCRKIVRENPELSDAIPGWHIEGPFISHENGYVGAHDPLATCDPTPCHMRDLKGIVGGDRVLLTMAPERLGALEAIREAVRCGFVVSLGHTDASQETLTAARQAGASAFTHLANGCPQQLDRHGNIVWRVLLSPGLDIGIIADGVHVSPALFRIVHAILPHCSVWWTTDAMAAAGAPAGSYHIGRTLVEVGTDRIVRHPDTGGFAGSSVTPLEAIGRGSEMLNMPWMKCWDFLSTNPARVMGMEPGLALGQRGFQLLQDADSLGGVPFAENGGTSRHGAPESKMRKDETVCPSALGTDSILSTAVKCLCLFLILQFFSMLNVSAQTEQSATPEMRLGIIGLDTSHAVAFTKALNHNSKPGRSNPKFRGARIVAAYPKGSSDIASSVKRVPEYTKQVEGMGVRIVGSVDELLPLVDAVLLESNDGRVHLEQLRPVLATGKKVFIDKPVGAKLDDVLAIYDAAAAAGVSVFSSSALRFSKGNQAASNGSLGRILSAETYSPVNREPSHSLLFWYGVHGVESLFTVMGTGCVSVKYETTEDGFIKVTGDWQDGRKGIFIEAGGAGRKGYGGKAVGTLGEAAIGANEGYDPLLGAILDYFKTGTPPVSSEETIQIYAFMAAAEESKKLGGASVTLESMMAKAKRTSAKPGK